MSQKFQIKDFSESYLKAPLAQPFRTALGEHRELENILFTLELSSGVTGFGEAAIATHITGESLDQTFRNLKDVGRSLIGIDISRYLMISSMLHEKFSKNRSVIAAVETALFDALTKELKIPLWKFFGKSCQKLQSDITIVISDLDETTANAVKFYQMGFRAFKIKIGRDADLDFKRVEAVYRLTRKSPFYLDANQGYSADQTLKFVKLLKKHHIFPSLLEQPVPKQDWEGLKRVTRLAKTLVCADESVQSVSDALRLIKEKAAHVINIKLMKSGFIEAREIALLARANGIKLMIGGMMETSLAMTASAHLASGLGCFDYIDLDTPFFIRKGFDRNPYLNSAGVYDLHNVKFGIGIKK